MVLIGIAGKAGVGKDYVANILVSLLQDHSIKWSFADQLKVNVMTHHKVQFSKVYIEKDAETRRLLQIQGTELGRKKYGQFIWVDYFHSWVQVLMSKGFKHVIVPDVRFRNEFEYIKQQSGIVIKVVAENRHKARFRQECESNPEMMKLLGDHASEVDMDAVDHSHFDMVLYNDPETTAGDPETTAGDPETTAGDPETTTTGTSEEIAVKLKTLLDERGINTSVLA